MAYITTEEVKEMRVAVKKAYPEFKLSVRTQHSMRVKVCIIQGPVDFKEIVTPINAHFNRTEDCASAKKMMAEIEQIIDRIKPEREVSYNNDYGSIPNYYVDVQLGTCENPYIFKAS